MASTWHFLNRHRGKLALATGLVGGYALLSKYLSAVERQWQKSSSRQFISEVKKKEIHFETTVETGNQTCLTLAEKIIDVLDALLDPTPIIKRIQSDPKEQKTPLRDALLVRLFTRISAEVYALVLLVAFLRVQLAILAGYIFVDKNNASSQSSPSSSSVQQQYLSLLQAFYHDGIHQVIEPVQEAVEHASKELSLKETVTVEDIKKLFESVQSSMSFTLSASNSNASAFLLLNQDKLMLGCPPTMEQRDVEQLKKMINETRDLLESDEFKKVLESGVDVGFSVASEFVFNCFVYLAEESGHNNGSLNPHNVGVPLDQLLPTLRQAMVDRKQVDRMAIAKHLVCLDVINCFAANIFEAFSSEKD